MYNEVRKDEDVLFLDIRPFKQFADGFISGSIFIPDKKYLTGDLLRNLIAACSKVMIVANEGQQPDSLIADMIEGQGKEKAEILHMTPKANAGQRDDMDMVILIEPDELAMDIPFDESLELVDVRLDHEFEEGHLEGARLLTLNDLGDTANIALVGEHSNLYLYCSDGERSMMAASILKRHGIHNLRVIDGRWEDISTTPGMKVEKEAKKLN